MNLADAKVAGPTHTAEQSKQEIASVTPTIVLGKGEEVALQPTDPPSVTGNKSDSPDPIRLKNEVVHLTKEYLDLDKAPQDTEEQKQTVAAQRKAKLDLIRQKFAALREAMIEARGEGKGNTLTLARVKFEKFLGAKATHGDWDQGRRCVETMANEAKSIILAHKGKAIVGARQLDDACLSLDPETKQKLGKKLGTPTNIGFAGAASQDFDLLMNVLTAGSLVQKAQTLIKFGEKFLGEEVLKETGPVYERVAANVERLKADSGFSLKDRLDEAKAEADPKKKYKILFSAPQFRAKLENIEKVQNKGIDEQRQAEAKAAGEKPLMPSKKPGEKVLLGGGMDAKIPQQPVELLNETQLNFLAKQGKPSVTWTDEINNESDAETRRLAKVKALKDVGIHLSIAPGELNAKGEVEGDGGVDATSINEGALEATMQGLTIENQYYIEGKLENIVDPKAKYIQDAVKNHAPLKAGISGTTARFLGCATMLGGSTHGAVIAMIGHLQAIEAHSFWEIVDAAGLGMEPGVYVPFKPNPGGMSLAAAEFVRTQSDIELGPGDHAEHQRVLLGQKK